MCCRVGFYSRASIALALFALLCAACGSEAGEAVSAGPAPDASMSDGGGSTLPDPARGCDVVEVDGQLVVERERDFTATFRIGAPYTKTVMLFGGESMEQDNIFGNAYVLGLDKEDALVLAQQYPDFYLCSSPGGQAAADMILAYDLVPSTCEVYEQIVAALRVFNRNRASGGDRTSIRFEGLPLEVESVLDPDGLDVKDQVSDQNFHLVTAVQQLTGESVLDFGSTE